MRKHSPGPWHIGEGYTDLVFAANGHFVADCTQSLAWECAPQSAANALLIACAPELLEVCKRLCAVMQDRVFVSGPEPMRSEELNDIVHAAKLVIVKAEGIQGP